MGVLGIVLWLVVLIAAFFVLIVRPQRRQLSAHRELIDSLAVGDAVITTSGIYGTIRAMRDDVVDLEITSGVVVKLALGAVARLSAPTRIDEPGTEVT